MRKYLIIFLFLLPTLSQGQGVVNILANIAAKQGNGIYVPPIIPPVDTIPTTAKNIRAISSMPTEYDAFGFVDTFSDGNVAGFWRQGVNHLEWGRSFYRTFDKVNQTWGVKHYYDDTLGSTLDKRDSWGGTYMRNGRDSVIIFTNLSDNYIHTCDWSNYIYYVKGGYDPVTKLITFNPKRTKVIDFDTAALGRNRGEAFGHITKRNDSAGHFAIMFFDWNQDLGTNFRTSVLLTSNYFDTPPTRVGIYYSLFSEGCVANMGGSRLVCGLRNDSYGLPVYSLTSEDGGWTWTDRGVLLNLSQQGGIGLTIPYLYPHNDTLVDIIYEDRGSQMIMISKNNSWSDFTVSKNPSFWAGMTAQPTEIWAYNNGKSGSNPSLGYPSICKLSDTTTLVVYSKELATSGNTGVDSVIYNGRSSGAPCTVGGNAPDQPSQADLMWGIDNGKDLNTFPAAPDSITYNAGYSTNTSVYVELWGVDEAEYQNIKGFYCDLSSVSDFSSFDSASVIVYLAGTKKNEIHNYVFQAQNVSFTNMIPNHTYYIRFRSYNGSGVSAWRQISFTTKP